MKRTKINILLIEDLEQDAALILREFRKQNLDVESHRVCDEIALLVALEKSDWDVILCDYNMPGFDALKALSVIKKSGQDIPFIIVSGVIGEETAVAAMRAGAQDYILKSNLSRLVPAVERELNDALVRKEKKAAEQKLEQALKALTESEYKFRRLTEATSLGIITSGVQGELYEVNDAYLQILGYSREEFNSGKLRWTDITPPEYAEIEKARVQEMLDKGACTPYEKEYFKKNGSRVPVLIGYALLRNETKCICFVADLSEQKRIEKQLQNALKTRDEFLSIASHELKTPLTSLSLQIEIISRRTRNAITNHPELAQLVNYLSSADRQLKRLNLLVEDLLDVTRIQGGKLSIQREQINVSELVCEVVRRFSDQATVAGCKLIVDIASDLPAYWDQHRIDQVLTNLISNAIKYAPSAPIMIVAKRCPEGVIISVADHGKGIAPCDRHRVFDRFERINPSKSVSGLGLGLHIVKQIIDAHGGSIEIEGTPGGGCTFIVQIPTEFSQSSQWDSEQIKNQNRFESAVSDNPKANVQLFAPSQPFIEKE